MINKISKYFSLFLLLALVNSNFSFSITQMACSMKMNQDACECGNSSAVTDIQFSQSEPACCKVNIYEIDNSNLLDKSSLQETQNITYPVLFCIQKLFLSTEPYFSHSFKNKSVKLPENIPVLYSSLLI